MRKRERENPCGICGHYHKFEEGEVCGICGHRMPAGADKPSVHVSAFASEILPEFLYLGSFDNAARGELLKSQGISCILNVRLFFLLLLILLDRQVPISIDYTRVFESEANFRCFYHIVVDSSMFVHQSD